MTDLDRRIEIDIDDCEDTDAIDIIRFRSCIEMDVENVYNRNINRDRYR